MYECVVCAVVPSIAILYEPANEITILDGLSCNEGSDEPAIMRMLVRVPPKDQDENSRTILDSKGTQPILYSICVYSAGPSLGISIKVNCDQKLNIQ